MEKQNPQASSTASNRRTIDIIDLPVVVRVRDVDGNALREVVADLILLKLACEKNEKKHRLEVDEQDCYVATEEFLVDLAKNFDKLGVTGCDGTMAYQIWIRVTEEMSALKKSIAGQLTLLDGTESIPTSLPENSSSASGQTSHALKHKKSSTKAGTTRKT